MDQRRGGVLPGQPHQAAEAIQVHRDLRDHAEERGRPPHRQLLLLGQQHRR